MLGLGTETGRSIHNPSSFQSLVGVRPTHGLVPIDGIAPLNGSFRDVAGPLAKTVYDAAVTLDAIAGPTPKDPLTTGAIVPAGRLHVAAFDHRAAGQEDRLLRSAVLAAGQRRQPHASARPMRRRKRSTTPPSILFEGEGATIFNGDIFGSTWTDKYYTAAQRPQFAALRPVEVLPEPRPDDAVR